MPASGGDPVTAALCLSLTASQVSEEDSIDKRLAASVPRVLLTRIEFEPFENYSVNVLSGLKNKYIVLKNLDTAKNGADTGASSTISSMLANNVVSSLSRNMKPNPDSILPTPKITLYPAEHVELGWRGTHCVGAGMINAGNTCYLNSTLQALFHVPAFVNWLHSDSSHLCSCAVANGTVNGECIICVMSKTLKASQSKSGSVIKPFLIYNRLKSICKHLVHGQQEDAHEFMRYLLESMEKAYLTRFKDTKLDNYSKETTPLNQIFGGYIRTEVTCLQCGGVSTTFQHCQDLLLDIRRASTLDDALAAYFCKERLDGDDAYHCEQCHRKVSATKKFSLEKPPLVLCLQFKRFSIMGGKITKHVSFSQRLDLTRFLCPQSANRGPTPLTYRLVSVVTHVGSSVHCGHYTAVALTSTGHYYQFDDSSVRPISLSAALDTNAYIMMYEREPKVPSVSQQSVVVSATSTVATCAVNGQKPSLSAQGPVGHKIGSVVNNRQVSDSSSTHTCASPLPPVKDRDRVVFGLHQSSASSAPPLVMHIKNGRIYRTPPRPSPQQQELSSSAATSSAASLVPYCESGEDESSSSDSEAPLPSSSDMPSLGEVSPFSSHSKPALASSNILTAISKRQSCTSTGTSASGEAVCSVTPSSNRNPAASCTAVSKSVQTKRADTGSLNTCTDSGFMSLSGINVESGSEVKSLQPDGICSQSSIGFMPHGNAGSEHDAAKRSSFFAENLQIRKMDVRNSSLSHSRNDAESGESWGAENRGNSVTLSGVRQFVEKEVTDSSSTTVKVFLPPSHEKHSTGWQVTDLLNHSPTVAGETSDSSSNSIANSTTGWAVSDVKQKHSSVSTKHKEPAPKCCCSDSAVNVNETRLLKGEAEPWKSCIDSVRSVECKNVSTTPKSGHLRKRKACDEENSWEALSHSTSKDMKEECYSKEYDRKQEKKLKKLKKHKKKEKSVVDEDDYEWVEKTHETLGMSTVPVTQTNGHCWDEAVNNNHLNHLSHRGYGSANVTSWSGECSRMDEEVDRDSREDRKRSYDNAYDEEYDRGRVKKVKHRHVDSSHSKLKYNRFQEYHNYKHQWKDNNNGSYYRKPYYRKGYSHYNAYQSRHKQYTARNSGYHNGNKYHNHYSKRNGWRP